MDTPHPWHTAEGWLQMYPEQESCAGVGTIPFLLVFALETQTFHVIPLILLQKTSPGCCGWVVGSGTPIRLRVTPTVEAWAALG